MTINAQGPSKLELDALDKCYAEALDSRDKLAAFHDCRHLFASYNEITRSLAAALIKNQVYTPGEIAQIMAHTLAEALTSESTTKVMYRSGPDVFEGKKQ